MAQDKGGQLDTVMQETRVFPPHPDFVAQAQINSLAAYEKLWQEAAGDIEKFWDKFGQELHWFEPLRQGARVERAGRQVVRRRQDERLLQLPRCPPVDLAQEQGRPHLGRRARRHAHADLSATAPRSLQVRQRAQGAGRRAGRRRVDLHADGARAGRSRCWPVPGSARCTR